MTIDLDDMALFAAVVRAGTFTAAAKALGVTKQSVSKRIRGLEEEAGAQLLARTTRSMRLTESGERFHRACEEIVARADDALRELGEATDEVRGTLRVTAPVVLGESLVVDVAAALRVLHPQLHIELMLTDRFVNLVEEGFDVAIRLGAGASKTDAVQKLGEARQVYVASPAFVSEHGAPRGLVGVPCITRESHERWRLGARHVAVEGVLRVNTFAAVRRAALAGAGVARLPMALVDRDVQDDRLLLLFNGAPAVEGAVYAVWREAPHVPHRITLFVDELARRAKNWPPLAVMNKASGPERRPL